MKISSVYLQRKKLLQHAILCLHCTAVVIRFRDDKKVYLN